MNTTTKTVSNYYADFGSVSTATMREQDLIPRFVETLDDHKQSMVAHYSTTQASFEQVEECKRFGGIIDDLLGDIERRMDDPEYYATEDATYDLEDLFTRLGEFAPPYAYFGSHPGDGADYGFWVSEELDYDFDGLKVDDLSEVADGYTGEVLHVNDHGNTSLYSADNGELTEIWALV